MCGILGGTKREWDYENALKSIHYRGPNGMQICELDDLILGFVRLSIRDLSKSAMQPMQSSDKKVTLIYNGEIYGYSNLKNTLIQMGYQFKTTSDTEVILNAFLEYGDQFVDYIDGMFAIAIYDARVKKLYLYRDRMGIKPLFYHYDGKHLMFASELKAILKLDAKRKFERDNTSVYDYFTYRYIPEPKTLFKNIYKLEPADKLIFSFDTRKIVKEKYWRLKVNPSEKRKQKNINIYEEVKRLIGKSVEQQLEADVPVGTFLSGGIDSSIISVEIFKHTKNVQAFSMGFQINHIAERKIDETRYAKLLAEIYQFPLTVGKFDRNKLKKLRKEIKDWYDEPFADTSCYPTYMISKLAKDNNIPVILTGDGGDEVFGGYTRYITYREKVGKKESWSLLCDIYTKILKPYIPGEELEEEFLDAVSLFAKGAYAYARCDKKEYIKYLKIGYDYDDFWYFRKYYHKELPPITRAQYIDFKTYLSSDILTKVDRASMQNSIEVRVPFLAKDLVEFAFALSQEERCQDGELKGILKRAYRDIIPREILYKEKKGFSFPTSYWNNNESDRYIIWNENWK